MSKLYIMLVASVLVIPAIAHAQTAKQLEANAKAIAKAEQAVAMSGCKLEWLQKNPGVPRTSPTYFGFMAECLTRVVSR